MTDDEFEVLDELYFLQSFQDLVDLTSRESVKLRDILSGLYQKGWIRIFQEPDSEVPKDKIDLLNHFTEYLYLASKEGLMAHNTID